MREARTLRGWSVPAGVAWELPHVLAVPSLGAPPSGDPDGEVRWPDLSPDAIRACTRLLRTRGAQVLRERGAAGVAASLGRVGARLLDEADPWRMGLAEWVAWSADLSRPMADAVIRGMAVDWTESRLLELLRWELGGAQTIDRFVEREGRRHRAVGAGLALHVVSGSVPGVSVTSMIRSLLVGSPVVLKPGLGDVVLPLAFREALTQDDPELADAVAVVYWPGGSAVAEAVWLAEADLVVVYGSDATIREFRSRAPATARVVEYGHRVSLGMVGPRWRVGDGVPERAATAVSLFDQRGCVSPHEILVAETAGVRRFAEALAEAMEREQARLPAGRVTAGAASAVRQLRDTVSLREAAGEDVAWWGAPDLAWTVVLEQAGPFEPSCLQRTVRVRPLGTLDEVARRLRPVVDHLQSVALEGFDEPERGGWAKLLALSGATRLTDFERLPWPGVHWNHDGIGSLSPLVHRVEWEE